MSKVKKCLQMFEQKGKYRFRDDPEGNPFEGVSFLDIALGEDCSEKDFVDIIKNKTDTYLYFEVSSFASELYEYEGFKKLSKKTQHLVVLNEYNIEIDHVVAYNDIAIKPFINYWTSYEGDLLAPDANRYIDDSEETYYLDDYTKITNWLLNHNDFKPNLPKSHPIVKWATRLSKSDAHAYAKQGEMLLEKLGMLESNKMDLSNMGWMELMEHKLNDRCKDFIMTKANKVHGLILYFYQDMFSCWCDYKEKEGLSLQDTDDWGNDLDKEELAIDFYIDDLPFDEDDQTVSDIGYLMVSIIMTKVVINLKKDTKLNPYFSENLKIGISLEESNHKPTFHGRYFGRYAPNSKVVKNLIKEYVSSKENEELITDLIRKQPTGAGLELWNELTIED